MPADRWPIRIVHWQLPEEEFWSTSLQYHSTWGWLQTNEALWTSFPHRENWERSTFLMQPIVHLVSLPGVGPEELLHEQSRCGGPPLRELLEALAHGLDEGVVLDGVELHPPIWFCRVLFMTFNYKQFFANTWVDESADPALATSGLVGEGGHTPVGQLWMGIEFILNRYGFE